MLPLFPLRVVLFPGALLPLHIFEPRYQQLLADVTADDHRFGLLPPGERGGLPAPGTIGCLALVRAAHALPEGRSNIVVSGERRFKFLEPAPAGTRITRAPSNGLRISPMCRSPRWWTCCGSADWANATPMRCTR